MNKQQSIKQILKSRIMMLDGAMATMIQKHNLKEIDFRGNEFKEWGKPLHGMYDLLNITQAQIIANIHKSYLESGADIITTNTFNANRISLEKYGLENKVYKINLRGAQIAKTASDIFSTQNKPRYVAGCIGPTNKIVVKDDNYNSVFNEIEAIYYQQAKALIDGGIDILLLETIYNINDAKAAISAICKLRKEYNYDFALMVSASIIKISKNDNFEDIKAFFESLKHCDVLSIGLNCSYGSDDIRTYIEELSKTSNFNISIHTNAGLPNTDGLYSETPVIMAKNIKQLAKNNLINIVGGCCGTTPLHIKNIAELVEGIEPRVITEPLCKKEVDDYYYL